MDNKKVSLTDYWNMLARHDWYYEYSDDHSIWRRGSDAESALRRIAQHSDEHRKLYDAFREHYFGSLYGRPATAKPPKPS